MPILLVCVRVVWVIPKVGKEQGEKEEETLEKQNICYA